MLGHRPPHAQSQLSRTRTRVASKVSGGRIRDLLSRRSGSSGGWRPSDRRPGNSPPTDFMPLHIVEGDLLDQDVEVLVNAWNRNVLPWWLLLPQGVSAAIKRRAGVAPFREVWREGPIPLGGAVLTGAGRLPQRGIIHVAGINLLWRSSEAAVRRSVRSALELAVAHGFASIALPLIGSGTGGGRRDVVLAWMIEVVQQVNPDLEVVIVRHRRS